MKDWGFAGQDYVDYKEGNKVKYFINGFGFSQKKDAKYHFKILVSKDGKIEELSICQGDKIATLKDGEFEVSSFKCKDAHNGNNLFNFVFINLDRNHKARYEKVFYSLVRYD